MQAAATARPRRPPTSRRGGFNLFSDTSCGTADPDDLPPSEPGLGPVRANGGTSASAYPLAGSPLVDAIANGSCDPAPELAADQRGLDRPFPTGGACDIGAVEQTYPPHTFTDVPPWVEDAVRWMTSDVNTPALMTGYPDNTFRPNLPITPRPGHPPALPPRRQPPGRRLPTPRVHRRPPMGRRRRPLGQSREHRHRLPPTTPSAPTSPSPAPRSSAWNTASPAPPPSPPTTTSRTSPTGSPTPSPGPPTAPTPSPSSPATPTTRSGQTSTSPAPRSSA